MHSMHWLHVQLFLKLVSRENSWNWIFLLYSKLFSRNNLEIMMLCMCNATLLEIGFTENSWNCFLQLYFLVSEKLLKLCFHSVEKQEILCHVNFFLSNQFIVMFFSKKLIWRIFCEKTVAKKFRNFHSTVWLCNLS